MSEKEYYFSGLNSDDTQKSVASKILVGFSVHCGRICALITDSDTRNYSKREKKAFGACGYI